MAISSVGPKYVPSADAAGSNQQIQYNNNGVLGASSSMTFDGTSTSINKLNISPSVAAFANQNALKVILVDLNDTSTMWNNKEFLSRSRYTSWYQELGAPPMRGMMFLLNDGTRLKWWDLDKDVLYMEFIQNSSNMLGSDLGIKDLFFLDGIIYTANGPNNGVAVIDLLEDKGYKWWTGGQAIYNGNIQERNDGNALSTFRTSPSIIAMSVNAVAAMRDPALLDEYGRPLHWYSVGTNSGSSIYNPRKDAIYDWHDENRVSTKQFMMNGKWFFTRNQTTYTGINWIDGVGVVADQPNVVKHFNPFDSGANSNYNDFNMSWTMNATISDISSNAAANRIVISSDEGLSIITLSDTVSETDYIGWNWITDSFQTPYMKGERFYVYPLNDLNDRSGRGVTLTNNGSVTFTSGPFGNTATFNGTSQHLSHSTPITVASADDCTISFYFKAAAVPTAQSVLWHSEGSVPHIYLTIETNGTIRFQIRNDSSNNYIQASYDDPSSNNFADGKWHHYCIVLNRTTATWTLYADGVPLLLETNVSSASYTLDTGFTTGRHLETSSNYFNGQVAQLSFCKSAWSENEIKLEFQRLKRALAGAVTTLGNVDIKSISVDPNTGLAALTTASNQTEIWDIETGLRESIDATTTATINDADIRLKSGATLPEYITARSGGIDFVGQERDVIGLQNNNSGLSLASNVTNSALPAFRVRPLNQLNNVTGDATVYKIAFDTEDFDRGNDFNNSTYLFTAPITGLYQLSVYIQILDMNVTSRVESNCYITTTNGQSAYIINTNSGGPLTGSAWGAVGSGLFEMDAGDTAHCVADVRGGTKTVRVNNSSWFSGFLVA